MSQPMIKHKQLPGLPPGIYFNLHEDDYHADSALNNSGLKHLAYNPSDYWLQSAMNQHKEPFKVTDTLKYGKQLHHLLLEHLTFFDFYNIMPGSKWNDAKEMITRRNYKKMQASIDALNEIPQVNRLLSDGYPEVTLIWICPETKIRMRCRIDYLRASTASDPHNITGAMDYKNLRDVTDKQLKWSIIDYAYDIQSALYEQAINVIREQLQEHKINIFNGDMTPKQMKKGKEFLKRLAADQGTDFLFVFQRKDPPHYVRPVILSDHDIQGGKDKIQKGKDSFIENMAKHGHDPWPYSEGKVEEFSTWYGAK